MQIKANASKLKSLNIYLTNNESLQTKSLGDF